MPCIPPRYPDVGGGGADIGGIGGGTAIGAGRCKSNGNPAPGDAGARGGSGGGGVAGYPKSVACAGRAPVAVDGSGCVAGSMARSGAARPLSNVGSMRTPLPMAASTASDPEISNAGSSTGAGSTSATLSLGGMVCSIDGAGANSGNSPAAGADCGKTSAGAGGGAICGGAGGGGGRTGRGASRIMSRRPGAARDCTRSRARASTSSAGLISGSDSRAGVASAACRARIASSNVRP